MIKRCVLAALAAGVLVSAPVFGHAKLQSSVPAREAQLQTAPKTLDLTFNENVQLAVLTMTVDGHSVPLTIDRAAAAAKQISVALPELKPGQYLVHWSALSVDDGHVTKGIFSFTIAASAAAASH